MGSQRKSEELLPLGIEHTEGKSPDFGKSQKGLTRRQLFFRGTIATAGLLFVAPLLRFAALLVPAGSAGQALTGAEQKILSALLLTFFPGGEDMPQADVPHLIPAINDYLLGTDPEARLFFRAMLHLIEDQALLFHGARFTELSPELQAKEVRAWELTPLYLKRKSFQSAKMISGMFYVEQPDVRTALGWYLGCTPAHLRPSDGGAGV